jgi:putative transcriptional regulator
MSLPQHHLEDDMLLAYAAGTLDEGASLVVAAHLSLCPLCRTRTRAAEALGGDMIETADPVGVAPFAWERVDAPHVRSAAQGELSVAGVALPRVLAAAVPARGLRWRFMQPGIRFAELSKRPDGTRLCLMRAAAGVRVATHGHAEEETSLVLDGGYADGERVFRRGDVQVADENTTHAPATDSDEGCLLLLLTRGPIRPVGWMAKLVCLFTGF